MALFMVRNVHTAEECELLELEWEEEAPAELKGSLRLFCTCPTGDHGAFFELEAPTAEQALANLPPRFRAGSRIHAGRALTI